MGNAGSIGVSTLNHPLVSNLLRQVDFAVLALAEGPIHINNKSTDFFELALVLVISGSLSLSCLLLPSLELGLLPIS